MLKAIENHRYENLNKKGQFFYIPFRQPILYYDTWYTARDIWKIKYGFVHSLLFCNGN